LGGPSSSGKPGVPAGFTPMIGAGSQTPRPGPQFSPRSEICLTALLSPSHRFRSPASHTNRIFFRPRPQVLRHLHGQPTRVRRCCRRRGTSKRSPRCKRRCKAARRPQVRCSHLIRCLMCVFFDLLLSRMCSVSLSGAPFSERTGRRDPAHWRSRRRRGHSAPTGRRYAAISAHASRVAIEFLRHLPYVGFHPGSGGATPSLHGAVGAESTGDGYRKQVLQARQRKQEQLSARNRLRAGLTALPSPAAEYALVRCARCAVVVVTHVALNSKLFLSLIHLTVSRYGASRSGPICRRTMLGRVFRPSKLVLSARKWTLKW
jgi:hypothetical protein